MSANQANTADFLEGGTDLSVLGGLRDVSAAQADVLRARAAAVQADAAAKAKEQAARLKASDAAAVKKIVADQDAASRAIDARSGGVLGDVKVIGKGVVRAAATVAKAAGTVAAVVPGGQVLGAVLIGAGAAATAAVKGDVKGVVTGAVAVAAPAAGGVLATAAKAAAPVLSTASGIVSAVNSAAAPVVQTLSGSAVVDQLTKGASVSASALVSAVGSSLINAPTNPDGLRVVVDKLLAAKAAGGAVGQQAAAILSQTAKLSLVGPSDVRASAAAAVRVVGEVSKQRAALGLGAAEQPITAAAAKAAAAYIAGSLGIQAVSLPSVTVRSELPKNPFAAAPPAPSSAPSSAVAVEPAPEVVIGFVVTADGRTLDGASWNEDARGTLGFMVRETGPLALRMDGSARLWRRNA